jgi:hypothetical protein
MSRRDGVAEITILDQRLVLCPTMRISNSMKFCAPFVSGDSQ